jgi:pumilio RNA-binding family
LQPPLLKGVPLGSPFVEEFKGKVAVTGGQLTLFDITGHFIECSLDQQCSRFMQQRLEEASDDEKQALFNEIIGSKCHLTGEMASH